MKKGAKGWNPYWSICHRRWTRSWLLGLLSRSGNGAGHGQRRVSNLNTRSWTHHGMLNWREGLLFTIYQRGELVGWRFFHQYLPHWYSSPQAHEFLDLKELAQLLIRIEFLTVSVFKEHLNPSFELFQKQRTGCGLPPFSLYCFHWRSPLPFPRNASVLWSSVPAPNQLYVFTQYPDSLPPLFPTSLSSWIPTNTPILWSCAIAWTPTPSGAPSSVVTNLSSRLVSRSYSDKLRVMDTSNFSTPSRNALYQHPPQRQHLLPPKPAVAAEDCHHAQRARSALSIRQPQTAILVPTAQAYVSLMPSAAESQPSRARTIKSASTTQTMIVTQQTAVLTVEACALQTPKWVLVHTRLEDGSTNEIQAVGRPLRWFSRHPMRRRRGSLRGRSQRRLRSPTRRRRLFRHLHPPKRLLTCTIYPRGSDIRVLRRLHGQAVRQPGPDLRRRPAR